MLKYSKGLLFVVSGPSGVGKNAVLSMLLDESYLIECVTCTTRAPRDGEADGVDYHFFRTEDFERKIDEGYFLEYACVHGKYYGTPREDVLKYLSEGKSVVLNIDVQGGENVKKAFPASVAIFIMPPDTETLRKRLEGRNTETSEQIELRLTNAEKELQASCRYDYVVVNDDLAECAAEVGTIIESELKRHNG